MFAQNVEGKYVSERVTDALLLLCVLRQMVGERCDERSQRRRVLLCAVMVLYHNVVCFFIIGRQMQKRVIGPRVRSFLVRRMKYSIV